MRWGLRTPMLPLLVETANASIPTYGLLVGVAFMLAFYVVHVRAPEAGIDSDSLLPVYLAVGAGGLFGARFLYLLAVNPSDLFSSGGWLAAGGMAYYGGVLGGLAAMLAVAKMQAVPLWKLMDLAAPAVVLALGIGRLGCFFAGCCHGMPMALSPSATGLLEPGLLQGQIWLQSSFPWLATEFHAGVGRLNGVALYPTQLWSAAVGIGLGLALAAFWTRRRFDGQVAALMLMTEPLFRIVIETFRADHRGVVVSLPAEWLSFAPGMTMASGRGADAVSGLTTSQVIGLAMVCAGAIIWRVQSRAGKGSSAV